MISCIKFIPNELTGGRFKIMVDIPVFGSVSKMIELSGFVDEKDRICGTSRKDCLVIKILSAIFMIITFRPDKNVFSKNCLNL